MFGGFNWTAPNFLSDTWEWDGTSWNERFPVTVPAVRESHAMSLTSTPGHILMFGGAAPAVFFDETWEWDGANWGLRSVSPHPQGRGSHSLAYDSNRGRSILFGGAPGYLSDTWEFESTPIPPPPCQVVGPGHPGGGLPITCVTPPRIGTAFCTSFSDPSPAGLSLLYLGPGPALNPPAVLSAPIVCAPLLYYVALPLVVLERGGNPAAFCIPIPAEPVLVGANVILQGAALELAGCFRATDGLSVTIQP